MRLNPRVSTWEACNRMRRRLGAGSGGRRPASAGSAPDRSQASALADVCFRMQKSMYGEFGFGASFGRPRPDPEGIPARRVSGRTMARSGLRMMPTFPKSSRNGSRTMSSRPPAGLCGLLSFLRATSSSSSYTTWEASVPTAHSGRTATMASAAVRYRHNQS
jgi:hypothetical protein